MGVIYQKSLSIFKWINSHAEMALTKILKSLAPAGFSSFTILRL